MNLLIFEFLDRRRSRDEGQCPQIMVGRRKGKARILRPLENGFKLYRLGTSLYNAIQKNLPLFHYLYFYFLEYASLHRGARRIIGSKDC